MNYLCLPNKIVINLISLKQKSYLDSEKKLQGQTNALVRATIGEAKPGNAGGVPCRIWKKKGNILPHS